MPFNSIDSFFGRFKKITPPNESVRKAVAEVLLEVMGVKIDISQIKVEGENIRIKNNPFVKSNIFLHKEQILQNLEKKLGKQTPKNIF